MTTCARYRRISEDRESEEAGITRQGEDLDALATAHRLTVVGDYQDNDLGASTRSRKPRPGFAALLADAKAGRFDVVIAYSSSRLTRRPAEHEALIELAERYGVRFLFVRSPSFDLNTADGRCVARILAANDCAESERTGERVARAARQRAENGKPHGGSRRFGYQADGVTVVPAEAELVRELTRRVVALESCRGLARDLRDRGVPTGRGGVWCARVVKEIVIRPRNVAMREHQGKVLGKASWPAIVDKEEWTSARAILLDPSRGTWYGQTPVSLLSGIAVCGTCGGRIRSGARDTYVGAGCNHVKRSRRLIDEVVEKYTLAWLAHNEVRVPKPRRDRDEVVDHAARIEAVRRQIELLEDRLADEDLSPAAYRRQRERKQAQLLALEAAQVRSARPNVMEGVTVASWSTLPLERRRDVVKELFTVTLRPSIVDVQQREPAEAPPTP
jgi:DNA invertase Pin-like site-specific DNA recombinase